MNKSNNIELLDLVFTYLKELNHSDTFENIWNFITLKSDINIQQEHSREDIIAELYTDLVLDNRFVLTSEGMWGLREFLRFDEIKKQYDYIDKFENTEEFEDMDIDYNDEIEIDDDLNSGLGGKELCFGGELYDSYNEEDDNKNFIESELDMNNDFKEFEYPVNDYNESVVEKLGITEEIDWQALEKEIEENN